ncbi:MBL fold metallo-hydrolase [Mechercharimyces sp. CAU 1602]|uniref:MBL fold metallo-hydrolase n=1 Tax=Mechercharimyces sp. CAU 1602 TaxID=2973933 RepID=UPI0021637589|nr:MBL fold metallo-hydrolase [Mechercharimyces sp. CAU 1602]MCS1352629.1 MBL fold metallo-hydrolase [Mechercharimyces sp. CAU 1602]
MGIWWSIVALLLVLLPLTYIGVQYWLRLGRMQKKGGNNAVHKPHPAVWKDEEVTVTWIGHATVLINFFGTKILTDPVLGERIGIHVGAGIQMGPKRITPAALSIEEVGEIDLVLLSHAHMDHLDYPTLDKILHKEIEVVIPSGIDKLLRRYKFASIRQLQHHEKVACADGITVTAIPVRHWGERFPWSRNLGYQGYVLEKRGVRLFFAGDTAYTPTFGALQAEGAIDVAFMPIGAYSPDSYQRNHCTPEQAWEMFKHIGARWMVPIHHSTFILSQEPVEEPLERLYAIAGSEVDRIKVHKQGEVFTIPAKDAGLKQKMGEQ